MAALAGQDGNATALALALALALAASTAGRTAGWEGAPATGRQVQARPGKQRLGRHGAAAVGEAERRRRVRSRAVAHRSRAGEVEPMHAGVAPTDAWRGANGGVEQHTQWRRLGGGPISARAVPTASSRRPTICESATATTQAAPIYAHANRQPAAGDHEALRTARHAAALHSLRPCARAVVISRPAGSRTE